MYAIGKGAAVSESIADTLTSLNKMIYSCISNNLSKRFQKMGIRFPQTPSLTNRGSQIAKATLQAISYISANMHLLTSLQNDSRILALKTGVLA
jgi:hypothetical protein